MGVSLFASFIEGDSDEWMPTIMEGPPTVLSSLPQQHLPPTAADASPSNMPQREDVVVQISDLIAAGKNGGGFREDRRESGMDEISSRVAIKGNPARPPRALEGSPSAPTVLQLDDLVAVKSKSKLEKRASGALSSMWFSCNLNGDSALTMIK